ncbi:hypothetical protein JI721_04310 [Alicyclobacillus cycloheptanicus]|uniref:Membrane protein n=1 Tax=Alicyclobacillus cycloheptanicus TaxID=1457 RepID=A0ABT9XIG4_9BACL|nr:hypothetical protein [Alicyclobacillus cycloheptanicus]MDQ0190078.1 putative membrane protein [Alicyclobacillus cycloheptanicus]WDM02056.1 hypothetical protein JI721_04310 [Alicyclobacillus cycloheptanicus]
MHELLHLCSILILIVVTAVMFTLLVIKRPGAKPSYSKKTIVGLLIVGAIIGIAFYTTQNLYAPSPTA